MSGEPMQTKPRVRHAALCHLRALQRAEPAGGAVHGRTAPTWWCSWTASVGQFLPGDPQVCAGLSYQRYPEIEQLGPPS